MMPNPTASPAAIDLGLGDQLSDQMKREELERRKKLTKTGQPGAQDAYGMDPMSTAAQALGLGKPA